METAILFGTETNFNFTLKVREKHIKPNKILWHDVYHNRFWDDNGDKIFNEISDEHKLKLENGVKMNIN